MNIKLSILATTLTALFLTACTYTERIKDGKTAYQRKQFAVAIPMLQKEYNKAKDTRERGEKAYQLAESYRRTHQYSDAADWFQKASRERYSPDAPLKQAQMLQQAESYDEAIQAYRTAGRDAGDAKRYLQDIIACRQAKEWKAAADENLYNIESLDFNTAATDFSPAILNKDQLIFSSDREESEGKDNYKWTGKKFFDLYSYDSKTDSVKRYEVENWNPEYHQGNLVFNKDKSKVFFTQCGSEKKDGVDFCKIMMAEKAGSSWSKPKAIRLGVSNVNYLHPCIDPEGRWMIFAANNKKGFGGYDLYISLWVAAEERWAEARNLGSAINTKGDEVFPYLDQDTLYFSSNGHPGMGGLDLFKAPRLKDRWVKPENLKAPMNSGGDDFGLIIDPDAKPEGDSIIQMGYITSNRLNGKGSDDIYRFMKKIPPVPAEPLDTIEELAFILKLDGLVKENILENPSNPNSPISSTKELMGATVRISTEDTVWNVGSDIDGTFYTQLDTGKTYYFQTSKQGYFNSIDTLSTFGIVFTEEEPEVVIEKEITLTPVQKGKEIVLENVYFDYNKWDIREDAATELNKLAKLLKENPDLNIMMTSHTDCRGGDNYNQTLSQKRAESTMQYLIQQGIIENRLQAKGFGETTPAAICKCNECSDDEHQRNRRTSFVVLE